MMFDHFIWDPRVGNSLTGATIFQPHSCGKKNERRAFYCIAPHCSFFQFIVRTYNIVGIFGARQSDEYQTLSQDESRKAFEVIGCGPWYIFRLLLHAEECH